EPAAVRPAVERALGYLDQKKFTFNCVSCHDGAWMLWSHREASAYGLPVNRKSVDLIQTRAGKNYGGHKEFKPTGMDQITDLSANPIYLTVAMATNGLDDETNSFLDRFADYLVAQQHDDGHWSLSYKSEDGDGPPAADTKNPDVITLWSLLALTS